MIVVCLGAGALGQAPNFDAASVKRRTEPGGGFMGRQPGGRFTAQGVSLQDLIVFAYALQPYQIIGGPRWLDTDRWDVVAAGSTRDPAGYWLPCSDSSPTASRSPSVARPARCRSMPSCLRAATVASGRN